MRAADLRDLLADIPDDDEIFIPPMTHAGGWVSNNVILEKVTEDCNGASVGWLMMSPDKLETRDITVSVNEIRH